MKFRYRKIKAIYLIPTVKRDVYTNKEGLALDTNSDAWRHSDICSIREGNMKLRRDY